MGAPPQLRELFERGAAAWPRLTGSWEEFAQMAQRGDGEAKHVEDLFLASACAAGQEDALEGFYEAYDDQLRAIIGSLKVSPDVRREARQLLETRLFVSGGQSPPKIGEYRGRGPLLAFLRVVAVRSVQELLRKQGSRGEVPDDELSTVASPDMDPELLYLKRLYRNEFAEAFARAIEGLGSRERTVLRYAVVDGLSIDRLAALYNVHRATAARQVARARAQLIKHTKHELMHSLKVDPATLESILRLVQSSVDVSARRLLAQGSEE